MSNLLDIPIETYLNYNTKIDVLNNYLMLNPKTLKIYTKNIDRIIFGYYHEAYKKAIKIEYREIHNLHKDYIRIMLNKTIDEIIHKTTKLNNYVFKIVSKGLEDEVSKITNIYGFKQIINELIKNIQRRSYVIIYNFVKINFNPIDDERVLGFNIK